MNLPNTSGESVTDRAGHDEGVVLVFTDEDPAGDGDLGFRFEHPVPIGDLDLAIPGLPESGRTIIEHAVQKFDRYAVVPAKQMRENQRTVLDNRETLEFDF